MDQVSRSVSTGGFGSRPAEMLSSVVFALVISVVSFASSAETLFDTMQDVDAGLGLASGQMGAQRVTFSADVESINSVSLRLRNLPGVVPTAVPVVICNDNESGTAPGPVCSGSFTTSQSEPTWPVSATLKFNGSCTLPSPAQTLWVVMKNPAPGGGNGSLP